MYLYTYTYVFVSVGYFERGHGYGSPPQKSHHIKKPWRLWKPWIRWSANSVVWDSTGMYNVSTGAIWSPRTLHDPRWCGCESAESLSGIYGRCILSVVYESRRGVDPYKPWSVDSQVVSRIRSERIVFAILSGKCLHKCGQSPNSNGSFSIAELCEITRE